VFLLFWPLYYGRESLFPWIKEPLPGKEVWLTERFLFARDGGALVLLGACSLALIFFSVREDRMWCVRKGTRANAERDTSPSLPLLRVPEGRSRGWRVQIILSPVVGICYAAVLSLLAFDLIMSLDPHWVSTLFGAYYFIGGFYTALAALIILAYLARHCMGMSRFIKPIHFYDLGKLLFGFCLVTGDFFYSQFLVIWYGNLPEETRYVILRVNQAPWETLAWSVLVICFGIPFFVLLSRRIKVRPLFLLLISSVIMIGMWFERFLLIAPSLSKDGSMNLGLPEVLVSGGFLGAVSLTILFFLRRFPLLPVSDPLFHKFHLPLQDNET
jgi:hypothetical protein